ncbi:DUF1284 domain-containing protein [Pseudaminobacter soli (ex Li et al. 2025)]|uniref:DUF1284 domain-containing protein n=1 Tax=Pseudaminobacter soli (ex Li et al. 2025) TaxID=1295366 RepID=A0A2P7SAC1_9HYPH|nr:DUF1284 domain-containing protein [Mesorhizobium soli]PSJ59417.1 DUF1284 domain-containing protein [Mesorhizobium soli]
MTVRIRAHHLLCMLTYVGKGYSGAFTANYDKIVERLGTGEDMLLVAGPDDICTPLLADREEHCFGQSVIERDESAAKAVESLLGQPISPGEHIVLDAGKLTEMRAAFRTGGIRQACVGCEWHALCTAIAEGNFPNTRLVMKPEP